MLTTPLTSSNQSYVPHETVGWNTSGTSGYHLWTAPCESFHIRVEGLTYLAVRSGVNLDGVLVWAVKFGNRDWAFVSRTIAVADGLVTHDLSEVIPATDGGVVDVIISLVGAPSNHLISDFRSAYSSTVITNDGALKTAAVTNHRDIAAYYGDSIMQFHASQNDLGVGLGAAGESSDASSSYAFLTANRKNLAVAMLAIPGWVVGDLVINVPGHLASIRAAPVECHLQIGRNDMPHAQNIPVNTFRASYDTVLSLLLGASATNAVYVTYSIPTTDVSWDAGDQPWIDAQVAAVAAAANSRLRAMNVTSALRRTVGDDYANSVHPNRFGNELWANAMFPALDDPFLLQARQLGATHGWRLTPGNALPVIGSLTGSYAGTMALGHHGPLANRGTAMSSNSATGYFHVTLPTDYSTPFTLMVWMRQTAYSPSIGTETLIAVRDSGNVQIADLLRNQSPWNYVVANGGGFPAPGVFDGAPLGFPRWDLVGISRAANGTLTFCKNGRARAGSPGTSGNNATIRDLYFGLAVGDNPAYFADPLLFPTVLSEAQQLALFNSASESLPADQSFTSVSEDLLLAIYAVKAKTDNLPASPAAVGSAMTLTSAYDPAKTAASSTSLASVATTLGTTATAVAAVKAKTDNLPSVPASRSDVQASGSIGNGADQVTLRFFRDAPTNSVPMADADVWVTSDSTGGTVVAGTRQTNSQGRVTFLLDAGETYYVWLQKDGFNPILGQSFVAEADA